MASRSLNRVTLIGNLTRDPELKYTPNGTAVCTFGVATNRTWVTNEGQQKEDTQYHRIVAWQKLAELCGKLLAKGKKVYLEGRITYRTFTGRDGQQRTITEIVLDDFIVFDSGRRGVREESVAKLEEEQKEKTDEEKAEEPEKETAKSEEEEEEEEEEEKKEKEKEKEKEKTNQEEEKKTEDLEPEDIPF